MLSCEDETETGQQLKPKSHVPPLGLPPVSLWRLPDGTAATRCLLFPLGTGRGAHGLLGAPASPDQTHTRQPSLPLKASGSSSQMSPLGDCTLLLQGPFEDIVSSPSVRHA